MDRYEWMGVGRYVAGYVSRDVITSCKSVALGMNYARLTCIIDNVKMQCRAKVSLKWKASLHFKYAVNQSAIALQFNLPVPILTTTHTDHHPY